MATYACPAFTSSCPEGFLCGSYAGNPYQSDIDVSYARWKVRLSRSDKITAQTAGKYVEPTRVVTSECPSGFYCPNSTTIFPCPEGYYCPEGMVTPLKCDGLSVCGQQSMFNFNVVDIVIAAIVSAAIIAWTVIRSRAQKKAERISRSNAKSGGNVGSNKDAAVVVPSPVTGSSVLSSTIDGSQSSSTIGGGVAFHFTDVAASASSGGRTIEILKSVSAAVPAGTLTAVMGPTSCGKSTLMSALRNGGVDTGGLSFGGNISITLGPSTGATLVGAAAGTTRQLTRSELKKRIGYVPQEDILDRSLTVRELLTFNCRTRLPHLSLAQVGGVVNEALSDLGLLGCADTVIGGGPNAPANISGGQLKRVNIGCELVALQKPAALLLDEPTAGLDASIANDLCATLDNLSSTGITVLMIVQQPRPEIFQRVRHLILMQAGSVVFEGPSEQAAPYLQQLGFERPSDASEADFCIDVLNGIVESTGTDDAHPAVADPVSQAVPPSADLALAWKSRNEASTASAAGQTPGDVHLKASSSTKDATASATVFTGSNPLHASDASHFPSSPAVLPAASLLDQAQTFLRLVWLNAGRAMTSRLRNTKNLIIYSLLHVIMAVGLSSGFTIYLQMTYRNTLDFPLRNSMVPYCPPVLRWYCEDRNQLDMAIQQLLFFMSSAIGCASGLAAIPLFGNLLEVVKRESSSGLSPVAFAVGRLTADVVIVVWNALIFAGVWLLFGHSGHWYAWLGVIIPTAFAASGVGCAAAVSTRPVNAAVVSIVGITAFCVFSGVEPTLKAVEKLYVLNWVWYLSFATWAAEGTYVVWTDYMRSVPEAWHRVMDGANGYGYDISSQSRSIGALIGIGLAWRVVTVLILYKRSKQ